MKARAIEKVVSGSTSAGYTGGYLVPEEILVRIDDGFKESSIFRERAYNHPMASTECNLPAFDLTATHATNESPLFGGMKFTWTAEGQNITESEPVFANAKLVAREMAVLIYASNQLVQDGGESLATFLEYWVGQALAWAIDRACFLGKGVHRPQGIVYSPATYQQGRAGGNHVTQADIANMVGHLLPACANRCVFACHPTVLPDIMALVAYQVNQPDGPGFGNLMGRPLYVTENLNTLGTPGDIVLFDPKLYALGQRILEFADSPYDPVAFTKNQTIFRFLWRGDGQPLVKGTATLADGTTTAGAFVSLN